MKKNRFLTLLIFTIFTFSFGIMGVYADTSIGTNNFSFCAQTGVAKTFKVLGSALYILKILIPILIIIFATIDFSKAVISNDDKEIKKAIMIGLKRCIAGVVIFFVPLIVNAVFSLISGYSTTLKSFEVCQACLNDPKGTLCTNSTK